MEVHQLPDDRVLISDWPNMVLAEYEGCSCDGSDTSIAGWRLYLSSASEMWMADVPATDPDSANRENTVQDVIDHATTLLARLGERRLDGVLPPLPSDG